MTVPSIGDISMLSQLAWKVGRAFSAGRRTASAEFYQVESEISGLAKALKLLAEALHADSGVALLQDADGEIQDGVGSILASCQQTINYIDSLIDQYQVIRKHRTMGGFAIERSWSDVILAETQTIMWTTEGGTLENLKDLLQMYTSSVTLLTQAVQSNSALRLERIITPMAERIDSMYHSSKDLDQQLDEVHRLVQNFTINALTSDVPPIPMWNPARSPTIEATDPVSPLPSPVSLPGSPIRSQSIKSPLQRGSQRSISPEHSSLPGPNINVATSSSHTEILTGSRASSPTQKPVSDFSLGASPLRYSSGSHASSDVGASSISWPSPGPSQKTFLSQQISKSAKQTTSLPWTPEVSESCFCEDNEHPFAMGLSTPYELERVVSNVSHVKLSPYPSTQPDIKKLHRNSTTASQKTAFEKEAFRNSAILCDIRGRLVEYSHRINEDEPRDVEMVQASDECRIAIVRKRVPDPKTTSLRLVTSIWAFSDDGTVRVELKMGDDQMYIPYSSYFSLSKVSITVPCELIFHDVRLGNRPVKLAKTSWVNYVLDTPQAAALFQNELMGRTLLATFRTEKTMRIHKGLSKSFAYAEQMCALENLRVWEDNDTGAIIALIHFSADFRGGYLAFYLNSSANPIRVKEDGNREVKIKGLSVPIGRGDGKGKKNSAVADAGKAKGRDGEVVRKTAKEKERVISGAKIEFATEEGKRGFLEMVSEMQGILIDLPELLGVN